MATAIRSKATGVASASNCSSEAVGYAWAEAAGTAGPEGSASASFICTADCIGGVEGGSGDGGGGDVKGLTDGEGSEGGNEGGGRGVRTDGGGGGGGRSDGGGGGDGGRHG